MKKTAQRKQLPKRRKVAQSGHPDGTPDDKRRSVGKPVNPLSREKKYF
jgi:hypothetical protein